MRLSEIGYGKFSGADAARLGMGREIAQSMVIFYADNKYVAAMCPERLQSLMVILVGLFERVRIITNTTRTKGMTCVLGRIRTRLLEDVYTNSRTGLVAW